MSKFMAIIPARYGSSRFPGKPLVKIGGVSMIERVYGRAAEVFDSLCVATDDERIEAEVLRFGGNVVMTSAHHPSGTDRVAQAVAVVGGGADVIVNIQGDEPFVDPIQLRQLCTLFDDPRTDIATLIKPFAVDENIFDVNAVKAVVDGDGFALYFSRYAIPFQRGVVESEWAATHTYFRHVGLYGYKASVLSEITALQVGKLEKCESLEQLRWIENGYKIKTAITTIPTYGIDTPEDLNEIEKLKLI